MPVTQCLDLSEIHCLAECLAEGLRCELFLTPKPGLVDLLDSGSHHDLNVPIMLESIRLVKEGYRQFATALGKGMLPLELVPIGRDIEERLFATFNTNTHKGALFLGGLLLCGLSASLRDKAPLPLSISRVARQVLAQHSVGTTHGSLIRETHRTQGIFKEALQGLPSVFRIALPALAEARKMSFSSIETSFMAMARLMQKTEDSTALYRCGPPGLARLREDGHHLESLLLQRHDPLPFLRDCNQEYQIMRLTMGGVADLLAMTFAVDIFLSDLSFLNDGTQWLPSSARKESKQAFSLGFSFSLW